MRKTVLYLVILAILGFGIYYFLFNSADAPYSQSEAGFTFKDTAAIGRIFIVSSDGQAITLDRTDNGWMVNQKYKALKSTLDMLLTTLYKQTPLYPVTKSAYDNAIKTLSAEATKVEVYDRSKKMIRTFYVGGIATNGTGTNMLIKDAHMPYVVEIQGFNGYISSRYTTNMADWRDRTVFDMPPEAIKTISVQYESTPINSFVLNKDKDSLTMQADEEIMNKMDGFNRRRAAIYTKFFVNINCEGYMNGTQGLDSSLKTTPKQSTIDLTDVHGGHQHADIYWLQLNRRSKNIESHNADVPDEYDADRLIAVINEGRDTVMIQQFAFRNIFRKAFEFYQNDHGDPSKMPEPEPLPRNVMMHKNK